MNVRQWLFNIGLALRETKTRLSLARHEDNTRRAPAHKKL
jgi:hypothetical protein